MNGKIAQLDAQLDEDARAHADQESAIAALQAKALQDSKRLDDLEAACLRLSDELQTKEAELAVVQDRERKCSREYIAYEKHRSRSSGKAAGRKGAFG